ncbi:MAG: 30S ribosomal protein S1 [Bryobacterales bacterium]|nr:30S ribosomal protein S1 [Bryobacterales bacterium]
MTQQPSDPAEPPPAPPEPAAEDTFAEALSRFEREHRHDRDGSAETRQGVVVAVTDEFVFFDIGLKMEGLIPTAELRDPRGELRVHPGDTLPVSIRGRDPDGYYRLSPIRVEQPKDWAALARAFAEQRIVSGLVTGAVKGGLSVDIGVRAFLPASRSGVREAAELEGLIGREIQCKIIELDVAKEDVVLDRRVVLEEEEARRRAQVFESLREGDVVEGKVRSLTAFGAFVDLGGVDGLLHVSDMSWGRVAKPSDVLAEGETLRVKILKIDAAARRISLGLKQLTPDPWTLVGDKYKPGDRVRGSVVRVTDFGAFVELEPGVEGLIRASELSWSRRPVKPSEIIKPGEVVEAVVLEVRPSERRLALGLKQALGDPWEEIDSRYPAGAVVEGTVVNLAAFGAFVEIEPGVEGMIHIGDIARDKRLKHPKEALQVGQRVRALVLEADRNRRRLRLGMKQLEPTTLDEYIAEHRSGDVVTGRLVEILGETATVELGDGIEALCRIPPQSSAAADSSGGPADLEQLTAMLAAKWKHGAVASPRKEPLKAGQVRSFRITFLDPAAKKIEVELAG